MIAQPTAEETRLDQLCINTIRTLSRDAVQQASSGQPGTPMAMAPSRTLPEVSDAMLAVGSVDAGAERYCSQGACCYPRGRPGADNWR